ncbi:MAG: hypothetical protein ACLUFW_10990 [Alistipes sp.]
MLPATEKTKITKAVRPSVAMPPTTAGSEPTSSPSRNNNAQMMTAISRETKARRRLAAGAP